MDPPRHFSENVPEMVGPFHFVISVAKVVGGWLFFSYLSSSSMCNKTKREASDLNMKSYLKLKVPFKLKVPVKKISFQHLDN